MIEQIEHYSYTLIGHLKSLYESASTELKSDPLTPLPKRFLVRQTIEERIHGMLKNYQLEHKTEEQGSHSTEENLLTIQDLKNIFVDDDRIDSGNAVEDITDENNDNT